MSAPGYTIGATSITVGSTSNWPTDTGVVFAIDEAQVVNGVEVQVAGTYNEYIGVVSSGTSVTSVSWQLGSGDRNYASGALTRVYIPVSAERENRIVTWGTAQHNQDGTHAAITTPSVTASGTVQGATVTSTGDILHRSTSLETIRSEINGDFTASGFVWSLVSGLNGAMTAGVAFIGGKRLSVSAIASRAFTASKDTYVTVDNAGTITYSEVANGATAPSLPANSVWLSKVVTSGAAITGVTDLRRMSIRTLPKAAAYRTTALTVNSFTKVIFNVVEFDTDAAYSTVDGKFTAPVSGYYHVDFAYALGTAAAEDVFVTIYKNGTDFRRGNRLKFTSSNTTPILSTLLRLNAGEYIEFYAYASAGVSSAGLTQGQNYMSVTMIP